MTRRGLLLGATCALVVLAFSASSVTSRPTVDLPAALSNAEFWRLTSELSEPEGFFDSDNLVSNEDTFQSVIPELAAKVPKGGVYLGVGPDQNFAYILATEPRLAIITDIRRGNLRVHLMYKALIELSSDRADFLSRLFSRPRPSGLGPAPSAADLFSAYRAAAPSDALFDANLRAIVNHLTRDHQFSLMPEDAPAIEQVYREFFRGGPDLRFVSSRGNNWYPSYADLQAATDDRGVNHGYLASELQFSRLKAIEQANLIVPIVGNFAGPRALRAAGGYVREHGATVSVFYTSNVERYLFQDDLWQAFMGNVATLPLTETSTFIRSCFDSCSSGRGSRAVSLLDSMAGLVADVAAGRVRSYSDVLRHSHGS